ncbi:transposase [bacterium]|nr:transposase [bacterium]
MGRLLRLKAPNLTYHITSRTNGKRLFIKKSKDRKALCRILQRIKLKYAAKIYGFTPMGNHFHLIIKTEEKSDISSFMCEFKTAYAKYYNTKYMISGHFWGDRFRSTIIAEDNHMLACLRYIDRNPVKAGIVDYPEKYGCSSYACYAFGKSHEAINIDHHPTYLQLSGDEKTRQRLYREYVAGADEMSDNLHGRLEKYQTFGNVSFETSLI